MSLVRNLIRRKLRTSLTIIGISVGIWALVVMSSMANKIGSLVEGGSTYFGDKIIVSDASGPAFGLGFTPIPISIVDMVAAVPGVAVAVPQIQLPVDLEVSSTGFGIPDFIVGAVADADQGLETFEISVARGRLLVPGDEGANVIVLGADLARKFDKGIGETMMVRGSEFEVVGVLESTLTGPDTTVFMPLAATQILLAMDAPILARQGIGSEQLATQIVVYPETGADINALAEAIEDSVAQVQTITGDDFDEEIGSATAIFNAIILGVALISLAVGGLSVINTMAMSVAERTREIGIKRSIGASRGRIVRELVVESSLIGLTGGIIGLVLGAIVVLVVNEMGRSSGTILFQLTFETAAFAIVFSTVLGALAGLAPAWTAARLDPVEALRYE
ncbi:MAG: ABC transporter permease [SAR202 cluster bacterium]|nr:ABC transporter permease [SAR202 cluster bacterium]